MRAAVGHGHQLDLVAGAHIRDGEAATEQLDPEWVRTGGGELAEGADRVPEQAQQPLQATLLQALLVG